MYKFEITSQELRNIGIEDASSVALRDIPSMMLRLRRQEVIAAYQTFVSRPIDTPEGYEGGIDKWIGFGSVTCCEIPATTLVGYGYNTIEMMIFAGYEELRLLADRLERQHKSREMQEARRRQKSAE